jgi:glucose/arabinose dehydrogenase
VSRALLASVFAAGLAAGCGQVAYKAVDQAKPRSTERERAPEISVPEGFRAVRVVAGLNYPSSMTWDSTGRLYVLESHMVPVPLLGPRILRVGHDGKLEELKLEGAGAPTGAAAIGLEFHDGWLYLSHEEKDGTWGISRLRPEGGKVEAVLRGLPGNGDHNVNYLAFDGRGDLYFGIGSATNSGVVSSHDPVNHKWLEKRPQVRDVPCRDLVLRGQTFSDDDALTQATDDRAVTGAFGAYGQAAANRVRGERLCMSAVYRLKAGAHDPEVMAWGFRNPVALAFAPDGTLLIGMHGADVRSTRPVLDDPDAIYRLREGAWYGWPDYSAALVPITDPRYRSPKQYFPQGQDALEFVIDHAASRLQAPDPALLVTATDPHAALGGMTVVPAGGTFAAWSGQLLISEMGDFRPTTDPVKPDEHAGFQVEAVDLESGRRTVFARNRGDGPALPASRLDLEDGLERPVDVKVGPDGLVYILDFGVFEPTQKAAEVLPKTGKVFRIEPVRAQ